MKLLYLSTWDFTNEASDGVCKKIRSQISVFEKNEFDVDFIYIKDGKIIYRESGQERNIGSIGAVKKTPAYMKMYRRLKEKNYDWVYNRYGMMDTFYYRVLKRLHRNGARILIEIPTYPYVYEKPDGFLYQIMFKWDLFYINRLKRIVDRIITYSKDQEIYSIPTISIMNGIDVSNITTISGEQHDNAIDLLVVALMQPYHGYERLLYGLKQYYERGGNREIRCHFVGEGSEKKYYEEIVAQNHLDEYVVFYGNKGGQELDRIYDKADIGVCSLGCYKKGIYWSSELKSKEYLAKGIPIIAGMNIDILEFINDNYYIQFPNDETVIDINQIVEFYDRVYQNYSQTEVIKKIRGEIESYINIEVTMQPVCEYMR